MYYQVIVMDKLANEEVNSNKYDNIFDAFKYLQKANLLTQSKFVHKRVLNQVKTSTNKAISFNLYDVDDKYIGIAVIQEFE